MSRIVLGTRGSALALWQARHVASLLRRRWPGLEVEERVIRTAGDVQQHAPLGRNDVGAFVRCIEDELLAGSVDLAVHSLKDLPTEQPAGLAIAAVPQRHDPADALLTVEGHTLASLREGALVGTGSPRRRCQLLHARPDLRIEPLRGNVDTRIRRVREGAFEAIVLARAGVERLAIREIASWPLPTEVCLPAVGQGALALETRTEDRATRALVTALEDPAARGEVDAERACLRRLGGGCLAAATAHARVRDGTLHLRALVGSPGGERLLRDEECGVAAGAEEIGERLAERLLGAGARELLELGRDGR